MSDDLSASWAIITSDLQYRNNQKAHATLARWREITAASEAAEATKPSRGVIVLFKATLPTATSFAIDTDLLSCKEAALLAATCRYIHKDENLKERHSEESRKIEKTRIEQKARDLLQALLEAPSPDSEFEVDDDEPTLDEIWAFMGL
jgi:hypothetical protein